MPAHRFQFGNTMAARKPESNLEWLMRMLPWDARVSLALEVEHFKNEPAVMAYLNKVQVHDWRMTHEVLRAAFPFTLSRFGYDYWAAIVETLPTHED